jgi:hypothetical protein
LRGYRRLDGIWKGLGRRRSRGGYFGFGIQLGGDLRDGPAIAWFAAQRVTHDVEEWLGKGIWNLHIAASKLAGFRRALRQGFGEGDAQSPDVGGFGEFSMRGFRRGVHV